MSSRQCALTGKEVVAVDAASNEPQQQGEDRNGPDLAGEDLSGYDDSREDLEG